MFLYKVIQTQQMHKYLDFIVQKMVLLLSRIQHVVDTILH